jgi:hypothetical protein
MFNLNAVKRFFFLSFTFCRAGGMNPGLKALWEDERERRILLDIPGRLTPPDSPPRPESAHDPTDSERFWFRRYDTMIAEKRQGNKS